MKASFGAIFRPKVLHSAFAYIQENAYAPLFCPHGGADGQRLPPSSPQVFPRGRPVLYALLLPHRPPPAYPTGKPGIAGGGQCELCRRPSGADQGAGGFSLGVGGHPRPGL